MEIFGCRKTGCTQRRLLPHTALPPNHLPLIFRCSLPSVPCSIGVNIWIFLSDKLETTLLPIITQPNKQLWPPALVTQNEDCATKRLALSTDDCISSLEAA